MNGLNFGQIFLIWSGGWSLTRVQPWDSKQFKKRNWERMNRNSGLEGGELQVFHLFTLFHFKWQNFSWKWAKPKWEDSLVHIPRTNGRSCAGGWLRLGPINNTGATFIFPSPLLLLLVSFLLAAGGKTTSHSRFISSKLRRRLSLSL